MLYKTGENDNIPSFRHGFKTVFDQIDDDLLDFVLSGFDMQAILMAKGNKGIAMLGIVLDKIEKIVNKFIHIKQFFMNM